MEKGFLVGQTHEVWRQEIEGHAERKASVPVWLRYKWNDRDFELKLGN